MDYPIRKIHIVRRADGSTPPEAPARPGDTIEVELASGFVMAVDPTTRQPTDRRQQFEIVSPRGNFLIKD